MGLVNIAEKEKEAKKIKDAKSLVLIKEINGIKYFSHKDLPEGDWYPTFDEALQAAQELKKQNEYKELGLNESGQTPEDAAKSEKIRELIKKKEEILKQVQAIDIEIAQVKNPAKVEVKEGAAKPKRTKKAKAA